MVTINIMEAVAMCVGSPASTPKTVLDLVTVTCVFYTRCV